MFEAGDVVILDFPGVEGVKRRPAVVISSDLYHTHRPDVIAGLLTTKIADATAPTDYILQDWQVAGLRYPSAFRSFLVTLPSTEAVWIGHLSDRDWGNVQACLKRALAVF